MKIEEIKLIQEKLLDIEIKNEQLIILEKFIAELTQNKQLTLSGKRLTLYFGNPSIFEFIGKEVVEALELKKVNLEKEIHNFTLDQLLPKVKDEMDDLGIKFVTDVDYRIFYYKVNEDGINATISCKENGGGQWATTKSCFEQMIKKGAWRLF